MRRWHRFWGGEDGAAALEFGLVAAPFMILIFGALQVFLLFLAQQMLETAAETSGRLILTGNAQTMTQAQFQQALCKSLPAILNCNNVMIDIRTASTFSAADTSMPTLSYNPDGSVANAWQFTTGQAGSIMVMRLMYQWPMFNLMNFKLTNLQTNSRLMIATAVFRNEAY